MVQPSNIIYFHIKGLDQIIYYALTDNQGLFKETSVTDSGLITCKLIEEKYK